MIRNYFKVALRNFRRHPVFSMINVIGLAIGISASIIIFLIVKYDFSFDKFHKDSGRIYRVVSEQTIPELSEGHYYRAALPFSMGSAVRNETTGLEATAAIVNWKDDVTVSVISQTSNTTVFKKQKHIIYTDGYYFSLFNYKWLAGTAETSLASPGQVVLSESNARLYFPNLSPDEILGKEIIFNDTIRTIVTGIVQDFKENSDLTFKTFISTTTLGNKTTSINDNLLAQLFIKLQVRSNPAMIRHQITQISKKFYPDLGTKVNTTWNLQPLSDLHFNDKYLAFDGRLGHKPTLYGLLVVAAFLLLLGCINFINLSTAQASQRAKEIGIRKTMGSSKTQLILQFLTETFLLTLMATVISVAITPVILKAFESFIPEGLHFNPVQEPAILLFLLLLTGIVSILSGFYPALVLSGYRPIMVLKTNTANNLGKTRKLWLRKTLTVSQFVIAQVFIIATILVSRQISYTINKDMGFKKHAIIYFETNRADTVRNRVAILKHKIKSIPGIANISLSDDPVTTTFTSSLIMHFKDDNKNVRTIVQVKMVDSNYINLYGLKLLTGKNLQQSDTIKEYIINRTYAGILGFHDPRQAIGKFIEGIPIVGVVEDFHQQSLHQKIEPIALANASFEETVFNLALNPQYAEGISWKHTIKQLEIAFKEIYPEDDFQFSFLDETISKYYKREQNISTLLVWATSLCIIISCLGLLGLVIYISNQRMKEIGVRKVLGASVAQIVTLLSKDFLKLIVLAFIIAVPPAWYGTSKWLENFAYRVDLNIWIFITGGLIMLTLAFLVLGIKTFKAASANPVKSLRTEG